MERKLTILLLWFSCCFTIGQNTSKEALFISFDNITGIKNTNLNYGVLFKEQYKSLAGNHHYFKNNEFSIANIRYNEETFYNVPLKYDITDDIVITEYNEINRNLQIALEPTLVEYFKIENHTFIYNKAHGFLEILNDNTKITLFKKHQKIKYKKLDKSFIYYVFKKKETYILKHNNTYYQIVKLKDLYDIFPNQKKNIKAFKKQQSFLLKDNLDQFYTKLIQSLENNRLNNEK